MLTTQPSEELVNQLDLLIKKTKDREAACTLLARKSDKRGGQLFTALALERQRFAFELDLLLIGLGRESGKAETHEVTIRRGLVHLGAELARKKHIPELYECYLAEYLAVRDYENLLSLDEDAPRDITAVLQEHLERTKEALMFLTRLQPAT